MPYQINDQVVHPSFGVGRIVGLVEKAFFEKDRRMYYEVTSDRSTAWVQVDEGPAQGMRPLTHKDELAHFRGVLRSRPADLNTDHRQRQADLRDLLKQGTMQVFCEMVRDLSGRGWRKPLGEGDANTLRKSSDALIQEWAAAGDVTVDEARSEVNGLLREARAAFDA